MEVGPRGTANPRKGEGIIGRGVLKKKWVGVRGRLPKTFTLFTTKICDFPYLFTTKIYDFPYLFTTKIYDFPNLFTTKICKLFSLPYL